MGRRSGAPSGICFFPQAKALDDIYSAFPSATWVLPTRPVNHWLRSINSWRNIKGILAGCSLPGLPAHSSNITEQQLAAFYVSHYEQVRRFARQHSRIKLVEVELEAEGAAETMRAAFGFDKSSAGEACWGNRNCFSSCSIVSTVAAAARRWLPGM